jgi:hypothetical protein
MALQLRGFPGPDQAWELADYLGDAVVVRQEHGLDRASQHRMPTGPALILLPRGRGQMQTAAWLVEELAHYLCRGEIALPAPTDWEQQTRGARRNFAQWEEIDEREARVFCDAWHLPAELVVSASSEAELLAESGADRERLRRRWEHLRKQPPAPVARPPAWSAWEHFRLRYWEGASARIEIVPRGRGGKRFELPVRPERHKAQAASVALDLAALRPEEFALKYRRWAVNGPRELPHRWPPVEPAP